MIVGIGCDIVRIDRFAKDPDRFASKILNASEFQEFSVLNDRRKLEFLSGHFAAKEALVKAMDQACLLSDFTIFYEDKKPKVHIDGGQAHISISHEEDYAYSVAIIER